MQMTKDEYVKTTLIGAALMPVMFAGFALVEVAVAPIRFVNDRVKNKNGESITEILRDAFKNPIVTRD